MLRRLLFESWPARAIEDALQMRLIGAGWLPPATARFLTATVHDMAQQIKELRAERKVDVDEAIRELDR